MSRLQGAIVGFGLILLVGAFGPGPAAQEAPDLEQNPVTGFLESIDTAVAAGNRVRHLVDEGSGHGRTVTLVSSAAGVRPRISIGPNGNSWVTWWVAGQTGAVFYAKRSNETGEWTSEVAVSDTEDDSRGPAVLYHEGAVWLAYEVWNGAAASLVAGSVIDDPEPIPQTTVVASTTFTGNLDLMLHSESGHFWLTWVDSSSNVGWSEFDAPTAVWSSADFEAYGGASVANARSTIRNLVLGE